MACMLPPVAGFRAQQIKHMNSYILPATAPRDLWRWPGREESFQTISRDHMAKKDIRNYGKFHPRFFPGRCRAGLERKEE
jgi:hypothetical protein